jgi:Ca2+-binding EF-hand superfamily protein
MKKITLALSVAALSVAGTALYAEAPAMNGMGRGMGHHRMMMDPMGDKTITRAEAAAKATEMFDKMDANHDGKVDKADREARQMAHFDKMDTDHNGSISRDEFIAAHQMKPMGAGAPDGAKMGSGMGQGMGKGMGHGMGGRMHGAGAMMMMARMADTNNDHAISKAEFTAAALKHFDMADANHDGKLTPEERKAAMAKMHERMGQHKGGGMRGMGGMGGMDHDGPMGDMPPPPSN